jgi:DNA polymerase
MSETDRTALLRAIRDEVVNLKQSPLYEYRVQNKYFPVIGQGDHYANIMFIGEAPGKYEAIYGRPFCGASGKLLDELLASIGLKREAVYITNIVKDRPPDNRDPYPDEIKLYSPFLSRQVAIIQPQVIATLGRFSTEFILFQFGLPQHSKPISALHGKALAAVAPYGPIHIVPLFHPAVGLHDASKKQTLFEDFRVLQPFVSS